MPIEGIVMFMICVVIDVDVVDEVLWSMTVLQLM